jgi:hypothetical protein
MSPFSVIFIILWDVFVIAGTSYLVFWEGHSGWWYLLAFCLIMSPVSVNGSRKIRPLVSRAFLKK